jgi:hypothetical protein
MAFLDSWEEELNDFVKKYYQNFFVKNGFKFLKKEAGQGGGLMIFSDSDLLVEVINNKKRLMIRIGRTEGELFGLDMIKAYFKITDYRIDEEDTINRKKALVDGFTADDYSGNVTYLANNFNKIKGLFSSASYTNTKDQLIKLDLEKQRFVKVS